MMPGESYWFAGANQTFDVAGNVVSKGYSSFGCRELVSQARFSWAVAAKVASSGVQD